MNRYIILCIGISFVVNTIGAMCLPIASMSKEGRTKAFLEAASCLMYPASKAVKEREAQYCIECIKVGVEVNEKTEQGYTPLLCAAYEGHTKLALALINAGADVNVRSADDKDSPLGFAAAGGHFDICKALLDAGALIDIQDSANETPLFLAAKRGRSAVCELLIERGAPVNGAVPCTCFSWSGGSNRHSSNCGMTPLHIAAEKGHAETYRVLFRNGVDVFATTSLGLTALHYAAQKGDVETCRMLVAHKIPKKTRAQHSTPPLHYAAARGHFNACKALLDGGEDITAVDEYIQTALHPAARSGNAELCSYLIKMGASVNAQNKDGNTPLHLAAENRHLKVCLTLIENGADIHAVSSAGFTPLHCAVQKGHWTAPHECADLCRVLCEQGADVNAMTGTESTPLHIALLKDATSVGCVLIDYGADVHIEVGEIVGFAQDGGLGGVVLQKRPLLNAGVFNFNVYSALGERLTLIPSRIHPDMIKKMRHVLCIIKRLKVPLDDDVLFKIMSLVIYGDRDFVIVLCNALLRKKALPDWAILLLRKYYKDNRACLQKLIQHIKTTQFKNRLQKTQRKLEKIYTKLELDPFVIDSKEEAK